MEPRFLILFPYYLSFVVSAGVTFYLYQHRYVKSAATFGFITLNQTLWTLCFLLETGSLDIGVKVFWDNIQFVNMLVAVSAYPIFVKELGGLNQQNPAREWLKYMAFPLAATLIIFTDPWHGWVRPSISLVSGQGITSLYYPFTVTTLVMSIYAYALLFYNIFLMTKQLSRHRDYFKNQLRIILVGILLPVLGGAITLTGLTPPYLRDINPLTFGLGNLFILLGLRKYGLFQVVPIARELLVENLKTAIIVIDLSGRVVDINPAAEEFLGHAERDCVSKPAAQVFDQHPDFFARFGSLTEITDTIQINLKTGPRYYDLSITPIYEQGRWLLGRAILLNDITQRREIEEQLQRRTHQLEDANHELESFSYSVSHDLRAPLRAISGFSTILMNEKHHQLDDEGRHLLEQINAAAQQMNSLIESLLNIARLARAPLKCQSIDLSQMAHEITADLCRQNPERAATFDIQSGLKAHADPQLIRTVLENLLDNAWKYSAGSKPTCITFGAQQQDDEMVYFVRDNGIGFDMKYSDKLFGAFQRLHRAEEFPGHGIGLASVKRIVHRHGGRIWAESEPGQGATFYFHLGAVK